MKTATFNCRVITPMFAGTAVPGECELRPPAIKGALRFWWRALHGDMPLADMRKLEGEIFGGVAKGMGRSSFSLSVETDMEAELAPFLGGHSILDYLAYGKYVDTEDAPLFHAKCFLPGPKSTFLLRFDYYDEKTMSSVWEALFVMMRFGGLGSKVRNGFGQFCIEKHPLIPAEHQIANNSPAPFTAFSSKTKLYRTETAYELAKDAHDAIGEIYQTVRKNLDPKPPLPKRRQCTNRVLVSQPITTPNGMNKDVFLQRHAKATILSVVAHENKFVGQLLLMPYAYLRNFNTDLLIEGKSAKSEAEYTAIHDSLQKAFDIHDDLTNAPYAITP